jgi:hypothetical protein
MGNIYFSLKIDSVSYIIIIAVFTIVHCLLEVFYEHRRRGCDNVLKNQSYQRVVNSKEKGEHVDADCTSNSYNFMKWISFEEIKTGDV